MEAARALASECHKQGKRVVYGGGTVGLMGEVAKTLVSQSGRDSVLGVIPHALLEYEAESGPKVELPQTDEEKVEYDVPNRPDPEVFGNLIVVKDMHTRKRRMAKEVQEGGPGSGFVGLPGGYGTMEEVLEITTWNQLNILQQPMVLYNVAGYWDGLKMQVNRGVEDALIKEANAPILGFAEDTESVMRALKEYQPSEGRYQMNWKST